uniref:Uncharacterized protein n=2 Tax=Aegilops tauschii subsp. strangulata TaxID=200361 RepID=A0A453E9Z2_AEGTS
GCLISSSNHTFILFSLSYTATSIDSPLTATPLFPIRGPAPPASSQAAIILPPWRAPPVPPPLPLPLISLFSSCEQRRGVFLLEPAHDDDAIGARPCWSRRMAGDVTTDVASPATVLELR